MSGPAAGGDKAIIDGRTQRAVRTRRLVVEAVLDLVGEGVPQPTAQQIADRSGVSMRSIFRLFDDVEALHAAAIDAQLRRVAHLLVTPDSEAPRQQRIDELVRGRAELFEAIAPVRRMSIRLAPTSRPIREDLARADRYFRRQLEAVFSEELQRSRGDDRRALLDALDAVTSWEMWERLRGTQQVPVRRARTLVSGLVADALDRSSAGSDR